VLALQCGFDDLSVHVVKRHASGEAEGLKARMGVFDHVPEFINGLNGRTAVWARTARPQAEAQGCAESLNGRTAVWTRTARPQAEAQGCAESIYTGVNEHFESLSNAERRRPSVFQRTASPACHDARGAIDLAGDLGGRSFLD
jgi:hypothetical protein